MRDLKIELLNALIENRISTICGVPDSSLSSFLREVEACNAIHHTVCSNEGAAVAYAAGAFLATGIPSAVYMQSSGIGNSYNPLISLASVHVSGIPMLLIIGWRGQPGTVDEAQHLHQGLALLPTLRILGIKYQIVNAENVNSAIVSAIGHTMKANHPSAIIIPRYIANNSAKKYELSARISRRGAIQEIVKLAPKNALFVATTGYAGRELDTILNSTEKANDRAFLVVGAMGHAAPLAIGLAFRAVDRLVVCIDGDGALQMHLGSLGLIKSHAKCHFIHIVINNGCHDSVGGHRLSNPSLKYSQLALELGYTCSYQVDSITSLQSAISKALNIATSHLIEVLTEPITRDLPSRPTKTPSENKAVFMETVLHQRYPH